MARSAAKSREAELHRLTRTLSARKRSNQAMMRAKDELEYAKEACKIVVEECGHALAWVGYAEEDECKTVRTVASAGFEEGYIETLKVTWADMERGRGNVGTAIRTGKPSVCNNLARDPRFMVWRRQGLHKNFASAIGLPLQVEGKTFGAIGIASEKEDAFSEYEVELLSGLANDFSYGIGVLRMGETHKQAAAQHQQSQKMEAVGLMAGGIAHDFNNILAVITGYNDLLLEGLKPDHRLRAHSLEIKHSSQVGALLTQQLLGISGNRGAQNRFLDPNSVILQMTKMLRRLLRGNIRLVTKLHRSVWPVMMGSGQMEQIVLNLAVNARDAMTKGGRLTVATQNLFVKKGNTRQADLPPVPGRYVVLEVGDTGCGMDPAVQARLFEPFFSTKGPGRGTGLGLSTLRTITDGLQGHISVESHRGRGTIFRIYLPSAKGGAKALMSKGIATKSHRGHGNILVVEDNDNFMTVIRMTLQQAGYTVFSARTAEEALSICGKIKKPLDLLLTDVSLPAMDGPELAKRVKNLRPAIRTVYMTGYPGNALGPISGFSGCVVLEKPFSLEKLLNTLREVSANDQGDFF